MTNFIYIYIYIYIYNPKILKFEYLKNKNNF